MDYQQAVETLRNRESKKIGNNTFLKRRRCESVALMLHTTDIITWKPDGTTVIDSGGWKTATTKARLNDYLPDGFRINQDGGVWYWGDWRTPKAERVPFTDGDSVKCGRLFSQATPDSTAAEKKLRKRILQYSKDIAAALPLEKPSGGDCWTCPKSKQGSRWATLPAIRDTLRATWMISITFQAFCIML